MNVQAIRKVLLVDDEEDICTVVRISLSELARWEVVIASSGEEALARAAEESPDIILIDVMLSGMDGLATYRSLREKEATSRIPVIFMTAKVQKHEVRSYLALGAAGVIAKPFDPMTLHREITDLMSRSMSTGEHA